MGNQQGRAGASANNGQQRQHQRPSHEAVGAQAPPAAGDAEEQALTGPRADDEAGRAMQQQIKGGVGSSYRFWGYAPGHPVLIVPGFMSSALTIQHSELRPGWEGTRAWLDLAALGVQSVKPRGGLFSKWGARAWPSLVVSAGGSRPAAVLSHLVSEYGAPLGRESWNGGAFFRHLC